MKQVSHERWKPTWRDHAVTYLIPSGFLLLLFTILGLMYELAMAKIDNDRLRRLCESAHVDNE